MEKAHLWQKVVVIIIIESITSLDAKIKLSGIKIGLKTESKAVGCSTYAGGDFRESTPHFASLRD